MIDKSTAFGRTCQPHSVGKFDYLIRMTGKGSKGVLWANVSRLMTLRYGGERLGKLAEDAGFGATTSTRLKKCDTSVGLDVIDQIAKALKVEPWQLLVPGLDPNSLPSLGGDSDGWPMHMVNRERFTNLSMESRIFVQGYLSRLIEEREVAENRKAA